jgi:trehalose/maltose hydrolase-like predicted phosphorylase
LEDEGVDMILGEKAWQIEQIGYNPEKEAFYDSIFSLANGYMGIRGFDEEKRDEKGYELCTFIAGVFDYFRPGMMDMVNIPNYNNFKLSVNSREFLFKDSIISAYSRRLDMKTGTLLKSFIWEDEAGNRTRVESARFLSISDKHIACIRYKVTPLNYNGQIALETGIVGRVCNNPINDDQMKNDINPISYLSRMDAAFSDETGYMSACTKGTGIELGMAFCFEPLEVEKDYKAEFKAEDCIIRKSIEFYGETGKEYVFESVPLCLPPSIMCRNHCIKRGKLLSRPGMKALTGFIRRTAKAGGPGGKYLI